MRDVVWGKIWIMGTQPFPHPGVQRGFWWGYGAVSIFAPQPWDTSLILWFLPPPFPLVSHIQHSSAPPAAAEMIYGVCWVCGSTLGQGQCAWDLLLFSIINPGGN